MASVSWLSLLIEDHVFYLALGYFISYLPYALLAKGLSSGIVPGVDRPPGTAQFIAVAFVVGAVVARSYPALRANLGGTTALRERVVVLVCGGNQSRSAMAEWMAQAVMATTWSGHLVTIASAGVQVDTPGTPMTDAAYAVLQDAGVIPHRHRSRPLTADLCRHADAIYCMTAGHRAAVLALAPDVADRTHCVAEGDIPEPSATSVDDHRRTAALIRQAVRNRPAEQLL